jgi:post-segregation antitoxin (ccd killing protein)
MRAPPFDRDAPKRTVSVTLNSELYGHAKDLGINVSQVAERAVERAYCDRLSELHRAELAQDLAALETYADRHGDFAELARAHYEHDDDSV